jgi:hypothetical protein
MYSLINQRDSRLNMEAMEQSRQIADESRKIAHLTRRDSTDMRIIAVVTMLFLPGTFTAVRSPQNPSIVVKTLADTCNEIQTLFSASFFDFNPDNSSSVVSSWIWLYCVMTVVLTILVLAAWWFFVRHQNRKTHKEIRRQSEMKETMEEENEVIFNRKMTLLQEQDAPNLAPYLNSGSVSGPTAWCMEGKVLYILEGRKGDH